jgi:hypothetical protein
VRACVGTCPSPVPPVRADVGRSRAACRAGGTYARHCFLVKTTTEPAAADGDGDDDEKDARPADGS